MDLKPTDVLHPPSAAEAEGAYRAGTYRPTHYEVLALNEAASARDVRRAYVGGAWGLPWSTDTTAEAEFAESLRERAYSTLGDPAKRAVYDRSLGVGGVNISTGVLRTAQWSITWAVLFGFLALFCLLSTDNASRWAGHNFAPGYREVRVYYPSRDDGESDPYSSEFISSSQKWQRIMNSWFFVGLVPAVWFGLVALGGHRLLDRWAATAISRTRLAGYSDTWPRVTLWVIVLGIPLLTFIYAAQYGLGANDYTTIVKE